MFAQVVILGLPYYVKCDYIYEIPHQIYRDNLVGCRVLIRFARQKRYGIIIEIRENISGEFDVSQIDKVIDFKPVLNGELIQLAKWMENFYISSLSEVFTLMLPSSHEVYKLKGKTNKANAEKKEKNFNDTSLQIELNDEQKKVFSTVLNSVEKCKRKMFYLRGVTGSGKTETLTRLAKRVVDSGRSVLYLVPEIALTAQLESIVLKIFPGNEVAVVHSDITKKKRIQIFAKCISGEIKMILGTRSSVFTPLSNLGLIIVDEEQDQSYKEEKSPRFNVRQIAQKRVVLNNSTLVFASATPSLECLKAIEDKKLELLELTKRINNSRLPEIINVLHRNTDDVISNELYKLIQNELDNNRGVILFLNRRGFLYHYKCQSCGFVKTCPNCSVSMVYHRNQNKFICHRCKYEEEYISKCPNCGTSNEIFSGYGTEYVENVVKNLFPFSITCRMDADTVSQKGESQRIINDFESGKINILIGTQMVSKGLNFRKLQLVGILNASQNILSSDFRQDEKLFSLLVQVSGRSGRFSAESKVVIQTDGSNADIIKFVKANRADLFYENEIKIRKAFSLPPFSRLARIVIRSENEPAVKQYFNEVSYQLHVMIRSTEITVVQEGQCPIYKEANRYRMQILIKSTSINEIINILNSLRKNIVYKNSVKVDFDIDPYDFM